MPEAPPTYSLTITLLGGRQWVHARGLLWDAPRTNIGYSVHREHDWAMEMATWCGWKVAVTRDV